MEINFCDWTRATKHDTTTIHTSRDNHTCIYCDQVYIYLYTQPNTMTARRFKAWHQHDTFFSTPSNECIANSTTSRRPLSAGNNLAEIAVFIYRCYQFQTIPSSSTTLNLSVKTIKTHSDRSETRQTQKQTTIKLAVSRILSLTTTSWNTARLNVSRNRQNC